MAATSITAIHVTFNERVCFSHDGTVSRPGRLLLLTVREPDPVNDWRTGVWFSDR
jgi:hypothetical protein